MVVDHVPESVEELETLLARTADCTHLCVKKRGKALTIFSGTPPHPHARLTSLGRNVWGLSFPTHTGRWERTPFVGTIEQVFNTLTTDFRLYLTDIS